MKRYLAILAVALTLGGCANLKTAFDVATTPVTVTPRMVNDIENGAKVGVAGLVGYRRLCIAKKINQSCRDTITEIQKYTRPLCTTFVEKRCTAGVIADLRRFVAQNDQVNAIAAFNLARQLLAGIQNTRAAGGI